MAIRDNEIMDQLVTQATMNDDVYSLVLSNHLLTYITISNPL